MMIEFALRIAVATPFLVPYYLIMAQVYGVPWWASIGLSILVIDGHRAETWVREGRRHE